VTNHPEIKLAVVFGSVAQSTAGRDSYVDVAVQSSKPLGADKKMQLIADLAATTARQIDLIDLRTAGEPLLGLILK
jgi:predicted nucleotidyltransferase